MTLDPAIANVILTIIAFGLVAIPAIATIILSRSVGDINGHKKHKLKHH